MHRHSLSWLLLGVLGTLQSAHVAGQSSNSSVTTPTPANIVCYQEIIGSLNGSYSDVSASIQAWAASLVSTLALPGDVHTYVDWAQVPDRDSFENGCSGPYSTVADVYVHIPTTTANYDSVSAALNAFVAANPWTSQPSISCGAQSVVTFLPGCGKLPSSPDVNLCFQEIVGSNSTYDAVSASLQAWATGLTSAMGLTGDLHTYVDWAQVPDRTGFENGCDGPYPTVADIYVHIPTNMNDFSALSAQLEAYVAAHPFTPSQDPNFVCGARSNTDVIPGCGTTPTQAPTSAPTQAPTDSPTSASTSAPTDSPTSASTSAPTDAPTSAPTGSNPTNAPTFGPTPANIVCYQEVVASAAGTYDQVSASIQAWAQSLMSALSLTGDVHTYVDWSPITDRSSFEGCPGPYTTLADVYVHIPTTTANYAQVSAALEAFVAASANSWLSQPSISCAARSDVSKLPGCGQIPPPPPANNPTLAPQSVNVCFQEIVGSNQSYPAVSASLQAWAAGLVSALSLPSTGDIHTYADWAQVTDRTGFENGCTGPYTTVADLFVHISADTNSFPGLSTQLEAYIAAHPFTGDSSPIACGARSNTDVIPGCGLTPTSAPTNAPTSAPTDAPTSAPTSAPTGSNPTQAPSSAPTQGSTSVPTAGPSPTPANVVCYQSIVGSNGAYADVVSSFTAWSTALMGALNLTGDVHTYVDWAQVTDRSSFEGCAGPYPTVADIFVHIPTTTPNYPQVSLALEAFILAHPISSQPNIACSARSDTTNLPTCGMVPSGPAPPAGQGIACYQVIVGSLNGTYAQVDAQIAAWAAAAQSALGLTGDVHTYVDWAQVPDRTSFENGCSGPYSTVADIFVHIPTSSPNYNTIVANIASYAQSHTFAGQGVIDCAAVSNVQGIPICGQFSVSTPATNSAGGSQQNTLSTSGAAQATHITTITYAITLVTLVAAWFH